MVTEITSAKDQPELVVSLEAGELEQLEGALEAISGVSETIGALAAVITHARRNGNPLVLGAAEGVGPAGEGRVLARVQALVDAMVPDIDLASESMAILAQRNAKRRTELLREFGVLTGEQVAEGRSRAENRHALASRWRKEGKLLGVPYQGQIVYPGFQFDADGEPRPVVAQALAALPRDQMSDWEVALWWTAGNGLIAGRRPVDLLEEDPDTVVRVAGELGEPLPL